VVFHRAHRSLGEKNVVLPTISRSLNARRAVKGGNVPPFRD
jgi:hypothetical protein